MAFGRDLRMAAMASDTRASVRPLTITRVPSAASDLAMAKPIPAVEPVTKAVLFSSFKFMDGSGYVFLICNELIDGGKIFGGMPIAHGQSVHFFGRIS